MTSTGSSKVTEQSGIVLRHKSQTNKSLFVSSCNSLS